MFVPQNPGLPAMLLGGSFSLDRRVDVYQGATRVMADMPILAGQVMATLSTRRGRVATLQVDRSLLPVVSPLGRRVIIYTGIRDMEMVPVFEGRIDSVPDDQTGLVSVECVGRGQDVQDARFVSPFPVQAGGSMLGVLSTLLTGGSFGSSVSVEPGVNDASTVPLVYEEDRGEACDDIARTMQAIWTDGRAGAFRVFPNPFAQPVQPPVAAIIRDGANGTLVSIARTTSRSLVANSVTVVVERTDGSAPVRVTAADLNPASPTYWLGPFGQQNKIVKTQAPLNQSTAGALAQRLLTQSLSLSRSWSITMPHYPLVDPGDVIAVWWNNEVSAQVIESVTYPLAAGAPMSLATREWRQATFDSANLV